MGMVIVVCELKCDRCDATFGLGTGERDRLFRAASAAGWFLYAERSNLGVELVDCFCPECVERLEEEVTGDPVPAER